MLGTREQLGELVDEAVQVGAGVRGWRVWVYLRGLYRTRRSMWKGAGLRLHITLRVLKSQVGRQNAEQWSPTWTQGPGRNLSYGEGPF